METASAKSVSPNVIKANQQIQNKKKLCIFYSEILTDYTCSHQSFFTSRAYASTPLIESQFQYRTKKKDLEKITTSIKHKCVFAERNSFTSQVFSK